MIAVSWPRDVKDYTLLSDQSSFAVHDVRDITSKEALATDHCCWQAVVGGKQNNPTSLRYEVMRRPGCSVGCRAWWNTMYVRWNDWLSCPMLIDSFRAHPTRYVFPVWLQHKTTALICYCRLFLKSLSLSLQCCLSGTDEVRSLVGQPRAGFSWTAVVISV